MYETFELDEHNKFALGPRNAFDTNDQKLGDFDNGFLEGLWQETVFANYGMRCLQHDTPYTWNASNFFPEISDISESHGSVHPGNELPYRTGGIRIEPRSPTTESEHLSPDLESAEWFDRAVETTQKPAQPEVPATSTGLQSSGDFLSMREGTPNNGKIGMDSDGGCKRPRSSARIEDDDVRERQIATQQHHNGGEQKRRLACPYRKFDPYRHRDCARYTLHRIKDVKQHIDRRHRNLDAYCARCYASFPSQTERDEHTRDSWCEILPRPRWVAVTEEQREKLNKTSCRKAPLEQQWFRMWDILFPGEPRPRSAFSGNYIEEVVPVIKHCWIENSSTIIDNALLDHGDVDVDKGLLKRLMDNVFFRLEEEVRSAPHNDDLRSKRSECGQESRRHAAKRPRIE